jgi:hypothetical protein
MMENGEIKTFAVNFRNISVVISIIFMSLFAASATAPGKVCE